LDGLKKGDSDRALRRLLPAKMRQDHRMNRRGPALTVTATPTKWNFCAIWNQCVAHQSKINYHIGQPGREHWGKTMSVLLAGGGLRMGQAVGSTTRK
jgi:hypothetical protein